MAQNPAMMQMAQEQMSKMSHEQAAQQFAAATRRAFQVGDRVKLHSLAKAAEHNGKCGTVVGSQGERFKVQLDAEDKTLALKDANLEKVGGGASLNAGQLREAQKQMQDPESMRQQAMALRSMDPEAVRRSNPAMANMSDEQIKATADQLDMVASNPAMLEMASKSLENMSPEQLEAMRNAFGEGDPGRPAVGDRKVPARVPDMAQASKMMEKMDPSQLDSMIDMVKQNPEMVKAVMKNNPMMGMTPEMVDKQFEILDQLPPEQLKRVIGLATKANKFLAPAVGAYQKLDKMLGGRLKSVVAAVAVAFVSYFVARLLGFFRRAPAVEMTSTEAAFEEDLVGAAIETAVRAAVGDQTDDDEFGELGT